MPEYKFYYFPFKALGEAPRMTLTAAGVPFEDIGIEREKWPEHKSKTPFGQMPVLMVDGKPLSQSMAIGRYVADVHGLHPKDPWQKAKADELVSAWADQGREVSSINNQPTEEAKKEKIQKVLNEFIIPRVQIYEDHFAASSSGLIADEHFFGVDMAKYPKITAFFVKVENMPKLKEFIESRKSMPWAPMKFVN